MKKIILLVGFRKGALLAARRLGYEAVLINDRMIREKERNQISLVHITDFTRDPSDLVREFLDLHGEKIRNGRRVAAVLALTERSVVLAAHLREGLNLPGNSPVVAHRCHDKWEMKKRAVAHHIPVTDCRLLDGTISAEKLARELGFPVVLKERNLSGGRSLLLCPDLDSLNAGMRNGLLAERFVYGQEMSIESFVVEGSVVFRNCTHYYSHHAVNILPALVGDEIYGQIADLNNRVIEALGIERGLTHMEIFLTGDGLYFGEIAIRPPGGYIMDLLEYSYGRDFWELTLRVEMGEKVSFPQGPKKFSASWVIHPGEGIVDSVTGVEEIKKFPQVENCQIKLKVGHKVGKREGSGEDKGRILFSGKDYGQLVECIENSRGTLRIQMSRGTHDEF